ncbi:hypothetical protein HYU94_03815 [Candidatus Daviesbacteria bacterium]|nr:hypothetical protein [Candidatus Daviesbacteria bacterium]
MDPYIEAISRIIKEQQSIIGPIALDQAKKVAGLQVGGADDVKITGNKKEVLDNLVNQYAKLFGRASVEVCKEAFSAVSGKIPVTDIPDILKN